MGFIPPSGDIYLLKGLEFPPFSANRKEPATKSNRIAFVILDNVVPPKLSLFLKSIN